MIPIPRASELSRGQENAQPYYALVTAFFQRLMADASAATHGPVQQAARSLLADEEEMTWWLELCGADVAVVLPRLRAAVAAEHVRNTQSKRHVPRW